MNLASLDTEYMSLARCYGSSVAPVTLFASAYLLWKRSHLVMISLALLPFLLISAALVTYPESIVKGRSIARGIASAMSPALMAVTCFFVFCFIYAGFLKKWGHIR